MVQKLHFDLIFEYFLTRRGQHPTERQYENIVLGYCSREGQLTSEYLHCFIIRTFHK